MEYTMSPEMEDMADAAGDAAYSAYQNALTSGKTPSECFLAACTSASDIMTEFGAPSEMVDTMIKAASRGFNDALAAGMNPQQCFDAAGDSVDTEFGINVLGCTANS